MLPFSKTVLTKTTITHHIQLFTYIKDQIRINDLTLDSCIPNPFAGTVTIDEINHVEEKQIALDTIVQFVHHYARNSIK